jgi:hypothetical protein
MHEELPDGPTSSGSITWNRYGLEKQEGRNRLVWAPPNPQPSRSDIS